MQVREKCGLDPQPLPSCNVGDLQLLGIAEFLLAGEVLPGRSEQLFCTLEQPALPAMYASSLPLVPFSELAASARSHAELHENSLSSICVEEDVLHSLFAQYFDQPCIELPSLEHAASAKSAPQSEDRSSMPLLTVPAVLPDHSSVTVRQKIAQALLESTRALDIHDPHPGTELSGGLTFHDMIAPGQVCKNSKHAAILSHNSDIYDQACLHEPAGGAPRPTEEWTQYVVQFAAL